jgi:transcriptional regulator with XRE-family HTH domain
MPLSIVAPLPLAEKLSEHRKRSGLSFDKLAERCLTDVSYLHALESGRKARPSRDIILRIGFGLGLEPELLDELLVTAGHLPLFNTIQKS